MGLLFQLWRARRATLIAALTLTTALLPLTTPPPPPTTRRNVHKSTPKSSSLYTTPTYHHHDNQYLVRCSLAHRQLLFPRHTSVVPVVVAAITAAVKNSVFRRQTKHSTYSDSTTTVARERQPPPSPPSSPLPPTKKAPRSDLQSLKPQPLLGGSTYYYCRCGNIFCSDQEGSTRTTLQIHDQSCRDGRDQTHGKPRRKNRGRH